MNVVRRTLPVNPHRVHLARGAGARRTNGTLARQVPSKVPFVATGGGSGIRRPGYGENAGVFVLGLPAHPLLVHAVVVLIPLAATGAVALAVRSRWNRPYGPLVAAAAVAGALAATVAMIAGEELQKVLDVSPEYVERIAQHSQFGLGTVIASWPFAVLAVASVVLDRRPGTSGTPARVVAGLSALAGLVALAFTVFAGHSGSASVWDYLSAG